MVDLIWMSHSNICDGMTIFTCYKPIDRNFVPYMNQNIQFPDNIGDNNY